MSLHSFPTFTVFAGSSKLGSGSIEEVARTAKAAADEDFPMLIVFDDSDGRVVELDLRGTVEDVLARLPTAKTSAPKSTGRGRPRLGVTAREITLLPSHWEWLADQPGGASAAIRRLVDQARRSGADRTRQVQEAAYRVMFAIAGDAPNFEEATRAFYANDYARFDMLSENWPIDVRDYVRTLVRRVAASQTAASVGQ